MRQASVPHSCLEIRLTSLNDTTLATDSVVKLDRFLPKFFIFLIEIQKSCKDGTESSPHPYLLSSNVVIFVLVHLSKLRNSIGQWFELSSIFPVMSCFCYRAESIASHSISWYISSSLIWSAPVSQTSLVFYDFGDCEIYFFFLLFKTQF